MTQLHFLSIRGKTLDIIDAILHTGEVVSVEFMLDKIHLVVEEVVTNIVKYAYPDGADGYLDVEAETPDTSLPMDYRPIGGLGIYLVKKNVDSVDYEYINGENILTVVKRIR